ncbi:hypothetical protein AJ88_45680 [Mesorhizobium amorphae CCBAU 01583]|nr:hypothetical protein AJ88_45680 [Mesorhizobium amorphae CCBAU 01583]
MKHHFKQYRLAGDELLPGGIDWYEIRNEHGEFEGFAAVVKAVDGGQSSRELIDQAIFGLARIA